MSRHFQKDYIYGKQQEIKILPLNFSVLEGIDNDIDFFDFLFLNANNNVIITIIDVIPIIMRLIAITIVHI